MTFRTGTRLEATNETGSFMLFWKPVQLYIVGRALIKYSTEMLTASVISITSCKILYPCFNLTYFFSVKHLNLAKRFDTCPTMFDIGSTKSVYWEKALHP